MTGPRQAPFACGTGNPDRRERARLRDGDLARCLRSSSSARKATATSMREKPATSWSKSSRMRRASSDRQRSRNCATGGNRSAMCAVESIRRLGTASSRSASARRCGFLRGELGLRRLRRERRRPEPEEARCLQAARRATPPLPSTRRYSAKRRASSSAASSGSSSASSALLVRKEAARLELEQRRDQHEELAAGVEVELLPLGEPGDERDHDLGEVDLGERQLLPQHERQQQVERTLERVEIEVELADRRSTAATRGG